MMSFLFLASVFLPAAMFLNVCHGIVPVWKQCESLNKGWKSCLFPHRPPPYIASSSCIMIACPLQVCCNAWLWCYQRDYHMLKLLWQRGTDYRMTPFSVWLEKQVLLVVCPLISKSKSSWVDFDINYWFLATHPLVDLWNVLAMLWRKGGNAWSCEKG